MTTPFELSLHHVLQPQSLRQLDAAGVERHRLRSRAWRRTSYGFYTPGDDRDLHRPVQRIADALPLVPEDGALAGWAAAYAHGVLSLDGLHPHTLERLPVVVALTRNVGRSQHQGVRFSRELLAEDDVTRLGPVRLTTPARTCLDLARWSTDLTEAVVVIDAFLQYGAVDLKSLRAAIAISRGRKGVPLARAAVELAAPGVLSPWETRLRVFWEVDLRMPRPLVNHTLTDHSGRPVGTPDLFDEEAALALEFDGAVHRERTQHSFDNVREEHLEALNVVVARVDSLMLRKGRGELGDRLRLARRRGLERDRRRDGWRLI